MRPVPIKMYVLLIWLCGAGKVQHTYVNLPLIACHLHSQGLGKLREHVAVTMIKANKEEIV